jgi:hypothetical protein
MVGSCLQSSYLGGRDQEAHCSRLKQKVSKTPSQPRKVGCGGMFLSFQLCGNHKQEDLSPSQGKKKKSETLPEK